MIYLPVPANGLVAGDNRLVIEQIGRTPDDIRIGQISVDDRAIRIGLVLIVSNHDSQCSLFSVRPRQSNIGADNPE